jgi:RNA polymerase sigma-70 factor (ECF subfamily)
LGPLAQHLDACHLLHIRKAKVLPMVENEHLSEKAKQDLHLVTAAKSGSQSAYAELMDRYRDSIYFMMLKMVKNQDDADDLTIEAFGKAFARLDQYSPSFAFSTWLFKIASNNCIDFIRKKRIEVTSIDRGITTNDGERMRIDAKSQTLNPEESIIHGQRLVHMRLLVSKLKPKYRELVEKRYFEEKSYEEIAEEMNLPLGTVKAQLFRARDFLAAMMEQTKDSI